MDPVFTIEVEIDAPDELNMWQGWSTHRYHETDVVPVVTGREEIEICSTKEVWDWINFAVDGFIRDSQSRPVGVFIQSYYEKERKEYGRYELLLGLPLTITLPTLTPSIVGDDEDTCIYKLTLHNGASCRASD